MATGFTDEGLSTGNIAAPGAPEKAKSSRLGGSAEANPSKPILPMSLRRVMRDRANAPKAKLLFASSHMVIHPAFSFWRRAQATDSN
jgi:hypothetical protein